MKTTWPLSPIRHIGKFVVRSETPQPGVVYRQVGVRLWGVGAYEREPIDGGDTKYSAFYRVEAGDVIFNKIWARHGAVAVVDTALSGTYGASEMRTLQMDASVVHPRWFHWLSKWPDFWAACEEESRGSSGKNRIKPERFLDIRIPLPSSDDQSRIVDTLDSVASRVQEADTFRIAVESEREEMLRAFARDLAKGAPRRPMHEVAPIVRRPVQIDKSAEYPELGIRSFGRGTFHKPPVAGATLGTKRLYRIEPGDLLFSNVFSWEGAIAVVQEADAGRFGSHRFITCVPNPTLATAEFLRCWLLTEEGMAHILEASPGAAGRNRTLGLKKLMAIPVPVPPLEEQRKLSELCLKAAQARQLQDSVTGELKLILPSLLDRAFSGDL